MKKDLYMKKGLHMKKDLYMKRHLHLIGIEQVLENNYQRWKEKEHIYEKVGGTYQAITYGDFFECVNGLAEYLLAQGMWNKNIMIYGENSTNLMIADFAVLNYVGVSVCVSKEWKAEELKQTIRFLDISCVIYSEEKAEIIKEVVEEFPALTYISMAFFQEISPKTEKPIPREETLCCKIVFSSGTTSNPKAVMLSKKNLFAGVASLYQRCPFDETDVDYLFLPLSHTYGGIYNFLYSLIFGFSIYLCSDISKMGQEILEVNPTLFCGVPAIYKRFYENDGEKINQAFGNRIQYLFCGGAYFEEHMRKAFKESGLNLMEAYALSETASTFAIQYPYDSDISSVGTVAEDIEVKIINPNRSGIGEIVVKGDNVFLGYAKNQALTESVFTPDGYFKTGDLGYLEVDEKHGGYKLFVTGRIKRLLVGANGENIDPEHIEKLIYEKDTNISKALLYMQEGRLGCHIYLKVPKNHNWETFFEEINAILPSYEKIKQYDIQTDSIEKRMKQ